MLATLKRDIKKQTGATMLEILISLIILPIGLLGLASLQFSSIKNSLDSTSQSQASWLAYDLAERMHANTQEAQQYYLTNSDFGKCEQLPARFCGGLTYKDKQEDASVCSAEEQAEFDVWDVFCNRTEEDTYASAADMIKLQSFSISCNDNESLDTSICSNGSQIEISVKVAGNSLTDKSTGEMKVEFIVAL